MERKMNTFSQVCELDNSGTIRIDSYGDEVILDNSIIYFKTNKVNHYYIMYNVNGRIHKERIRGNNTKSKIIPKRCEPIIKRLKIKHKHLYNEFMQDNGYLACGSKKAKPRGNDYYTHMFGTFKRAKLVLSKGERIFNLTFLWTVDPLKVPCGTRKVNVSRGEFKCKCGNTKICSISQVTSGNVKSCGCMWEKNKSKRQESKDKTKEK